MSRHLDDIIEQSRGSASISTTFLDIVAYSKRKTAVQQKIITKFNAVLKRALGTVSAKYVIECQSKNINLATDIIKIPTGDGAAVVFSFSGFHNIALDFACEFLSETLAARGEHQCQEFTDKGWCNCHDFFDVRIGISDGGSIIYKDINGNFNVAGNAINIASRVMGLAERQSILLDSQAFKNITDMTEDVSLDKKFVSLGSVAVKHGLSIDVFQYVGSGENYLNIEKPKKIEVSQRTLAISSSMPNMPTSFLKDEGLLSMLDFLDAIRTMPAFSKSSRMFDPTESGIARMREAGNLMTRLEELMKGQSSEAAVSEASQVISANKNQ